MVQGVAPQGAALILFPGKVERIHACFFCMKSSENTRTASQKVDFLCLLCYNKMQETFFNSRNNMEANIQTKDGIFVKIWKEFKDFAFKGNVIDMAVGVMIGSAFSGIVTSVVNNLFTPVLSLLTGKVNFEAALNIPLGDGPDAAVFALGTFVQSVVDFLLMAICVFLFVKFIGKLRKKPEPKPAPRLCPYCFGEVHKDATRCPHCTSPLDH